MFFSVKETSFAARMASKRMGDQAVKAMERELQKAREEQQKEKDNRIASQRLPSAPIVTPGRGVDGGATPRRTPSRLGI